MATVRYKAGIETREKILDSTRRLISEAGLDGTTIKAICDAAGVLPGSFYNQFESKEQAIMAVVREAIDAIDPDPDHTGPDKLHDLVEAFGRFLIEQDDLACVYIRLAVSGGPNGTNLAGRVIRHHEGRVARFAAAIASEHPHLKQPDSERRAETLVSALNGIALHKVIDDDFDVETHVAALLQDALRT